MQLLAHRPQDWTDRLICLGTRRLFSHAAVLCNGRVHEAVPGAGVPLFSPERTNPAQLWPSLPPLSPLLRPTKTPTMKKTLPLLATLLATLPPFPGRAQNPTPTPTPAGYVDAFRITPSAPLADRQTRTATRLSQRMVTGETQLLINYRALYNEVWHNADGLTPQQVCDALGARASNLFVIAGTMANALYSIDPVGLGAMVSVPAGRTATINPDGTVTITTAAPSPTPTPSSAP